MTSFTRLLAPLALLVLAACGDPGGMTSSAPIPLEGGTWVGTPMDPTEPSDKVRVISFFRPT